MKNSILLLSLLGASQSANLFALNWFLPLPKIEISAMLARFLKQNEPPAEVIANIDKIANIEKVVMDEKGYKTGKRTPGYCLKTKPDRLLNTLRLKKYIQQNELTAFNVPQKYIYCRNADNNRQNQWQSQGYLECIIVAEHIKKATKEKILSKDEVNQAISIAEGTGFADWHSGNIILDENGKINLIDTEDISFRPIDPSYAPITSMKKIPEGNAIHAVGQLYDQWRKAQVREHINTLLNDPELKNKQTIPIYDNSSLDPEGFDLNNVRKELEKHRYTRWPCKPKLNHELFITLGSPFE